MREGSDLQSGLEEIEQFVYDGFQDLRFSADGRVEMSQEDYQIQMIMEQEFCCEDERRLNENLVLAAANSKKNKKKDFSILKEAKRLKRKIEMIEGKQDIPQNLDKEREGLDPTCKECRRHLRHIRRRERVSFLLMGCLGFIYKRMMDIPLNEDDMIYLQYVQ